MLLEENKPLAPFTTFGIGGPARWFVEAASEAEIDEAAVWAGERGVALFVLGGGSNLLVSDSGFDGLVLRVKLRGILAMSTSSESGQADQRIYSVAAGEDWDGFVERSVRENCAGIECLAGIPGTVGGTPVQNVGAYGQEVASVLFRVQAYDILEHAFVEIKAAECGFAYRRSRFNTEDRGRFIVTRVDYRLTHGGAPTLRYAELQQAFPEGSHPSLAGVAAQVRRVRRSKGMLMVEGDPDCRSAGSFFKNPVVTDEQFRRITTSAEIAPPYFPAGLEAENQGQIKIPAAWLIEQAGFHKGYVQGAAAVSSRHTLAIINRDGASAAEVLSLAGQMNAAVEARFGFRLEMEPVMLGF